MQQAIGAEKQKLQKLVDVRTRVANFRTQITRFNAEIDTLLADVGIDNTAPFHAQMTAADIEPVLARRNSELSNRSPPHAEGDPDNPVKGTLRWIERQIKALTEKDTADKARQQRIKTIQERISAIDTEVKRLEGEINLIEGPDRERLKAAREERLKAYGAYFDNLKTEQQTLEELYAPVKARLSDDKTKPQEQELEFSIRWEVDLANWLERGGILFDQRKIIPYGTMAALADAAKKGLLLAWASGDTGKIKAALGSFSCRVSQRDLRPADYLRTGVTISDVLEWRYEVDHIKLSYGLKYNGASNS